MLGLKEPAYTNTAPGHGKQYVGMVTYCGFCFCKIKARLIKEGEERGDNPSLLWVAVSLDGGVVTEILKSDGENYSLEKNV